ncbi:hypothetical protein EOE67_15925 [Rheinheimera riviphila]|uniref:Uncharacterized protein n=1 Tax=Rheinheimera riviphila TaxID=1834037 RepID=A0A437QIK2_9GAMM|nr:DUF6445 family protein [Rheinheimera riviphila]RVU34355.1 hypothetical protein EOE67_15925 [Rheinheimera riviphila]
MTDVASDAASAFVINTILKPQLIYVGTQQTPVLIIDDLALDLPALLADAASADFQADAYSYYPGVRALLPRPYVIAVLDAVYQLIYQVYQVPSERRLKPQDIYYSLITSAEQDLKPLQCLPHFDSTDRYYFALLHYLSPEPHGGTGLFRHRPTGLEKISAATQARYFQAAEQHLAHFGAPPQRYCVETNDHFELYQKLEYRQNRLVIYPGNLLHSSLVNPATDIAASISEGRLTANIFINFLA